MNGNRVPFGKRREQDKTKNKSQLSVTLSVG